MKTTIKKELSNHILDRINDGILTNGNKEDWHFYCFNEDYYIIGSYEASQWLKANDIGEFEAVGICQRYEIDNFGENQTVYNNSEKVVNMLVYIYGEELLSELNASNIEELKEILE